jgi:hypothetical protein
VKPWERISITLILCITWLAAVWLHGILNRYEVFAPAPGNFMVATRYDRITGGILLIDDYDTIELGVKSMEKGKQSNQSPSELDILKSFKETEKKPTD